MTKNRFTEDLHQFLFNNSHDGGYLQLIINELEDCTVVLYTTDFKYSQNMDTLCSLPHIEYRGYAAGQVWSLLNFYGIASGETGHVEAPADLPEHEKTTWAAKKQARSSITYKGRYATLTLEEENLLREHLATLPCPRSVAPTYQITDYPDPISPEEIYKLAERHARFLNDRNEAEFNNQIAHALGCNSSNHLSRAQIIENLGIYTCDDDIEVDSLREEYFRPFSLAGIRADTFFDNGVGVQLFFNDQRNPGGIHVLKNGQEFTHQFCLAFGFESLILNNKYREWVKTSGQRTSTGGGALLLNATQLLAAPRHFHNGLVDDGPLFD